jgi:molybdopterin-containing oxidoreductase family iron-sulfur binding subunit
MDGSRRDFLKMCGLFVLAMGLKPVARAFGMDARPQMLPAPEALKARRWAMVVDLKKCKGDCTACIDACHRVHNVPTFDDPRHEIKWIWREKYADAFPSQYHAHTEENVKSKPLVVLCNHCDNPPCTRVCPVKATWKRAEDGIVMMDFHRCIGCRYCMAACPYGARSFNWFDPRPHIRQMNLDFPTRTKGVVEKCNFCVERLAKGQRPACVEACAQAPNGQALLFGDLQDPASEVSRVLAARFSVQRKPELGTRPQVYYIV